MGRLEKCVWFSLLLSSFVASAAAYTFTLQDISDRFPQHGLEDRVTFWKAIFTRFGERDVVFHDTDDLRLIYHIERFTRDRKNNPSEIRRQRSILKRKHREVKALFDDIIRFGPESSRLDARHRKIIEQLTEVDYPITAGKLRALQNNIRYQRGIKEKFKEGIIRSGRYLDQMKAVFQSYDLPEEIAYLPHVESSFNYNAYSKAGAAGIWQFTRGTGRNYLRINRFLDERLDPVRATDAAARLMRDNFAVLGNWPLTITSYNHGKNGMLRAKKKFGSQLTTIIEHYESRYFGFASKNFYAEFLAAVLVAKNQGEYFGPLVLAKPLAFETVRLKNAYDSSHLTTVEGLSREVLISYNPHLKRILSSPGRAVPAGAQIRVPTGKAEPLNAALQSARPSTSGAMIASDGSTRYRVRRGDVLGDIASSFGTTVGNLKRLNGIKNANRIHVGQVLLISSPTDSPRPVQSEQAVPSRYRVRPGDNMTTIARRFDTTVEALARANAINNPHRLPVGMTLDISKSGDQAPRRYRVRRGDTLAKIARRFGTSVSSIKSANQLRNANLIQHGQELIIP